MKLSQFIHSLLSKLKVRSGQKMAITLLVVLTTFSVSTYALGRQNAPCSGFWDCAYTVYHGACNGLCPWY